MGLIGEFDAAVHRRGVRVRGGRVMDTTWFETRDELGRRWRLYKGKHQLFDVAFSIWFDANEDTVPDEVVVALAMAEDVRG